MQKPGSRRIQAAKDIKQGGFSRAGGTHDRNEFSFMDIERYTAQGMDSLVAHDKIPLDIVYFYNAFIHDDVCLTDFTSTASVPGVP